jgi:hypothetical protein
MMKMAEFFVVSTIFVGEKSGTVMLGDDVITEDSPMWLRGCLGFHRT